MKMVLESSPISFSNSTIWKVCSEVTKIIDTDILQVPSIINIIIGGQLVKRQFAYVDETANYTFVFDPGFDDNDIYPGELCNYAKNLLMPR